MKTLLQARTEEEVGLLVYAPEYNEAEDRNEDGWVESVPFKATVTSQVSDELSDIGQNVMNRRKVVRIFGRNLVGAQDRLLIKGETYEVDGIPNEVKMITGKYVTTLYAIKEGTAS